MADPLTNGVNNISVGFSHRARQVASFLKTATVWGGLVGGLMVVGPAFAMQPELLSHVANSAATNEAATTLTGAIAQHGGNLLSAYGTGIANSGPVWEAYGSAATGAWEGISQWWTGTDFTPNS